MDRSAVVKLLTALSQGEMGIDAAFEQIQDLPFQNVYDEDLQFARLDMHRAMRQGMPEVIYCPGKTASQVISIASKLREKHDVIVGTKASAELAQSVQKEMPQTKYFALGKILLWGEIPAPLTDFAVSIITAGTSDMPIAEEAALYLQAAGVAVSRVNEAIGVAGLHRLLAELPQLKKNSVCIVVAGMDGALPGVVGGLLSMPIIAVPTSIGYGASFAGLAPLLTMLNSCAAGVTVVNIDNGFGAAVAALRIMNQN